MIEYIMSMFLGILGILSGVLLIVSAAIAVMFGYKADIYRFYDDERCKKCYIISYTCLGYILLWLIGFGVLCYNNMVG